MYAASRSVAAPLLVPSRADHVRWVGRPRSKVRGSPRMLNHTWSRIRSAAFCLLAVAAAGIPGVVAAQVPRVGPERGTLVVVGGAMQSDEIYQRFIDLAGGPRARIVLVPTAGEDDEYDESYAGLE